MLQYEVGLGGIPARRFGTLGARLEKPAGGSGSGVAVVAQPVECALDALPVHDGRQRIVIIGILRQMRGLVARFDRTLTEEARLANVGMASGERSRFAEAKCPQVTNRSHTRRIIPPDALRSGNLQRTERDWRVAILLILSIAMPNISFETLSPGQEYDRPALADLWGYRDWHAISRGVITPAGQNLIVLFVTREKQDALTQYRDHIEGDLLHWEGETNHGNDSRIIDAKSSGDEIHLFYRERHHSPFIYYGRIHVRSHELSTASPSRFIFSTSTPPSLSS